MPNGAGLQRLANQYDPRFLNYIHDNAESWYHFVNSERRRGIPNGHLRVVWGWHKSVNWGMATLLDSHERTKILRFRHNDRIHPESTRYSWDYLGPCYTKSGPHPRSNHDLFAPPFTGAVELQNQCLFIRNFSVSLNIDASTKVPFPIGVGDHRNPLVGNEMPLPPRNTPSSAAASDSLIGDPPAGHLSSNVSQSTTSCVRLILIYYR